MKKRQPLKIELELTSVPEEQTRTPIYGIRYPDGSVDWVWEHSSHWPIKEIVENDASYAHDEWIAHLREKAKQARIDPNEYVEGHSFLRGVIETRLTEVQDLPLNF